MYRLFVPITALVLGALLCNGCAGLNGLKIWQQGHYFTTDLNDTYRPDSVRSIGIYVFSDGEAVDNSNDPFDALELIPSILFPPFALYYYGGGHSTRIISPTFYPSSVSATSVLEPDSSNTGASLELAKAIQKQLAQRDYSATVVTDIGHSGDIPVATCLDDANAKGYDAACIVSYGAVWKWRLPSNIISEYGLRSNTSSSSGYTYEGFIYLPNVTIFSTASHEVLWSNSFYGVYEHAHVVNLSDEPFTKTSMPVVLTLGESNYFEAAPRAAAALFNPIYWRESFKGFPPRNQKERKW